MSTIATTTAGSLPRTDAHIAANAARKRLIARGRAYVYGRA
ncbi:hypothetical protein [Microbacterium sp. AK031]|nr:hypothetical protein [Microbacterium sp. AK031]MCS3843223.1 methionine synthase II (cobalamin-independent) [Microbacterium sp. AK031]